VDDASLALMVRRTTKMLKKLNKNCIKFDGKKKKLYSFHLEFCWMESPRKRQRLVRTYGPAGLAISSTYSFETKV
jgi:hypothetical protein